MEKNEVQFDYRVKAIQREDRICQMSATEVETTLDCATPPEFPNGIAGVWSPETLFLASIASCYINTYQSFCDKFKMTPVSLECEASGTVSRVDGKLAFSAVMLNPIITLKNYEDEARALDILDKAHRYCLISNSVKCPVSISENILILVS